MGINNLLNGKTDDETLKDFEDVLSMALWKSKYVIVTSIIPTNIQGRRLVERTINLNRDLLILTKKIIVEILQNSRIL